MAYSEHHPALLLCLLLASLLLTAPDLLNVIPAVIMIRLVAGDVQFPYSSSTVTSESGWRENEVKVQGLILKTRRAS
ncbi:hypothetical protein C8R43DRAFT_1024005 [Mycena crocata]|nr:hypothetical protein C8R43DRAFT_1024005 [Mycena crocata]